MKQINLKLDDSVYSELLILKGESSWRELFLEPYGLAVPKRPGPKCKSEEE